MDSDIGVDILKRGRLKLKLSQDTSGEDMEEMVMEDMVALAMVVDTMERDMLKLRTS